MRQDFRDNHQKNVERYRDTSQFGRLRADRIPAQPVDLPEGARVKFYGDRRWWTVRASSDRFAVLTRSTEFQRPPLYTVIDWQQGRRGPHDSWGCSTVTDRDCLETLDALIQNDIALSERHSIHLDIETVDIRGNL